MKRLLNFLFGRRTPVLVPSLVREWIADEVRLSTTLKLHLQHAGVQALIQALEMNAALEQASAIDPVVIARGGAVFHAGGAHALLEVLNELRKLN